MLVLKNIIYKHPNRDLLFDNLNLTVNEHDKIALIGNNGIGKSTLLKIMAGVLSASEGSVKADSRPYYIPQLFGQFNDFTVAGALRIQEKLKALKEILDGIANDTNLTLLDDDWAIEERCSEALSHWKLDDLHLTQKMESLSGGQKTKVFLAGIMIHRPEIVLMDEPSNHLDTLSRQILYDYVKSTSNTLVVISHDRTLLNLLDSVFELGKRGIAVYGGNYDFYKEQKMIEGNALNNDLRSKEKQLRKAKETEREALEKRQRSDARGKKQQEKGGLPKILMNARKNSAENTTSRMKDVHAEKIGTISQELYQIRKELPGRDKMKLDFDNSALHKGKILITANYINFGYDNRPLWKQPLNFRITSGERLVITGRNGSGKTTLIKMILGEIEPQTGVIDRAEVKAVYIDQDYSLIDNNLTIYEQAQKFNYDSLEEHEIKIRLNRFLFTREYFDKPCRALSGGEKMRLMLCCLMISNHAPDIFILDEPTNNLDIQNTEILTNAINEYKGTLIVVSHDTYFLEQINVEREITLE